MLLKISNLSHSYGKRVALQNVSLEVEQGELYSVVGPNGGGKSTLFKILSTILPVTSGSVSFFGLNLQSEAYEIRKHLGVVFQNPSLDKQLTVEENLLFQGRIYGLPKRKLARKIAEVLEVFGLADRKAEEVLSLSGGLKRRVEIAKTLLHEPAMLLMDEPTTGLDPLIRKELWAHLDLLRKRKNITILLTTHLLEEAEHCDRVAFLDQGRLLVVGKPQGLRDSLGGSVIKIKSPFSEELSQELQRHMALAPVMCGGEISIHAAVFEPTLMSEIMKRFGAKIDSVEMAKPTLEDLFLLKSGHRYLEVPA